MKKVPKVLSFLLISSKVFAADCDRDVLKIAKLNLDSNAKVYGFEYSDITQYSLKKINQDNKSGSAVNTLIGSIY